MLSKTLVFRGGTALYELYLKPAARYSEDIDLVQMRAEPAVPVMDALRSVLGPWLCAPRWKQTEGRVTLDYRFTSEDTPPIIVKLKVEINLREHFAVHGFKHAPFNVTSRWFNGRCEIPTYELAELLGTKLLALYQSKKGDDLFDLAVALSQGGIDPDRIVKTLASFKEREGHIVTRALFEMNMHQKCTDTQLTADIGSPLTNEYSWYYGAAAALVQARLTELLPS